MRTAIHCLAVLLGRDLPATQVSGDELKLLLRHAEGSRTIVEIGTFEGATAAELAAQTGAATFSIDPFLSGRLGISYGRIIAHVWRHRRRLLNLTYVAGYSFDVAPSFVEPIDFLFIDADHSYDGLARDWQDWAPKVRPGGKIALHDVRVAPSSPVILGSMRFFAGVISGDERFREVAATGSLVVVQRLS